MIKKMLAWLMVWSVLMSFIVVPGSANNKLSVGLDDGETAMPGETVDLNVNLSGNPALAALSLRVYYEKDKLECVAIEKNSGKEGVPSIWKSFVDTIDKDEETANCQTNPNDTT